MLLASGALFAGSSLAQEQRPPSVEDVSEAAEIRISLPAAAADHPALDEEMTRRARTVAKAFRAEAEQAMAEAADDPDYPWAPWTLDYIYEPRYLGPVYASFLVNVLTYQGGAHPALDYETMTRDLELNEPVSLFDLFADASEGSPALTAISGHVQSEMARQKEQRLGEPVDPATAEWLDAVAPRPENFDLFTFEPAEEAGLVAGLSFHYPPYVLGPYAEGPYEVFVPADVFADHLAGYYPQVFGGEPVVMARLSSYEQPGVFVFLEEPTGEVAAASPLAVAGEAPAAWFEAGDVTLRVTDLEGNVLGEVKAEPAAGAETSGITSGMRRFTGSVSFDASGMAEGQLVIAPPDGAGSEVAAYLSF